MAEVNIKGPEDYKLYFHTSREGNVSLDGKGKPIPLDQTIASHVDSFSPIELLKSRCTTKSIHPKNMPQSDWLSPEDTIIQHIMADPNINPNLLQAALNTLSSRINQMQSAQATPTLGATDSSGFNHKRLELGRTSHTHQ